MNLSTAEQLASTVPKRKKLQRNGLLLLLMALPFVVLVFIFYYVPLFGWVYAFYNYKPGIPLSQSEFVGLKYFQMALSEGSELGTVLRNTLGLSFLGILTSPLPIAFAIMLSEVRSKTFKKLTQTLTTLPNFVSWVIVFSLFFSIFSVEGLMNQLLAKFHLIDSPLNPLANPDAAWYMQTAIGIWKGLGWGAIIYLAAITGIDAELYDAAKVDGAGRFQTIWHITVPGIMPTYFVLLLLSISGMLSNGFEQYFVFMNPLVNEKLNVLDYYLYNVGIVQNDYSYSTALGIFKTIVSILLLFTANLLSKRIRGQSII